MNKLYLRTYGGLLLAIFVIGLVCTTLFQGLGQVRRDQFETSLVQPVADWLILSDYHVALSEILGTDLNIQVFPLKDQPLTQIEWERLNVGQTVLRRERATTRFFRRVDDERVLALETGEPYRDVADWLTHLVVWIDQDKGASRAENFAALSRQIGRSIQLVDASDQLALPGVLEQLAENGIAFEFDDDQSLLSFARLSDGAIVRIDHGPAFSNTYLFEAFLISLIVILGLAATIYLLFSPLDKRLKRLESVAGRIARGELEARIGESSADSIGRVELAFNSMAEHIQRLVNVQREMIHAVSHELRTPVARIRFGVQMIEDCDDAKMRMKQIAGIDSDIQELDELIDEILTYARLEQGGPVFTLQEADVKAIVDQVVSEQSLVKPEMDIRAVFSEGSEKWCLSDVESRYIHRAIQNLVGNATRYADSQVRVNCSFDKDTCRVDVEDDGPGIPESDWEKVFTAFARLDDSRTRSSGGYGLGLSIVRRILYWHGGQAFLGRSELGGARFSLVWPRSQVPS